MKPQPKKPQPKQAAQAQAKPQESIQPQKKEEPPKQEPQKVVQIVEPPKPKENLKLNELKKQWLQFQLYSDVKDAIEEQFNVTKIPLKDSIRDGKIEIKDQIEDFDKIIKKQKAKLRKHEFEEGLIHMRLRHNLLSQHEYEERKKFISVNLDLIPEKDKEFQEKLGIREYFMNKNSVLLHSTIEKSQPLSNAHKLSLDLTKPLIPTTQLLGIGSLTERGKSSNDKHRNKEPKLFNFKTLEEKQKHDEFINKIRDQDKERRKLKKQLEQLHQKAEKEKVEKLNFEKQKEHEKQEQDKKKRFLDIQEALSKKEKERIEQKQQQDQALTKLFNHQPLHIKMEFQYKNEVELPLLEQKKKKLEEIRQFFKQPLDKKDISNHQKKYESEADAKQREREKKKQQKLREFYERQQDIYESKYVEMDQKQKEEEEERMRERKLVKERMNDYFESIKDTIKIRDDNSAKKLKKSDEQQSDLFKIKTLKHGAQSARGLPNLRSSLVSEEKVKKNQEKEKVRQEVLSKDYLKEVLSHQKGKLRESAAEQDIGRYMNDQKMSDRDRFDLVHLKAKQYEDKAKLDEQLLMLDDNDPKAVQKAIEQGQCNEISDLYLSESLLNVEVDNITQTIGIQYIYNFHLLWFDHNATNIEFVNNFKDGLIFNRVYNKTILAFSNETSHQLYQKQEDGKFILNGTMLQNYTDIDLMLIELPEEIRPLYNLSAVNITNLTMLISSEDMQILKQNITNAKNRTFTTRFIYFTYMNCPKVSFYKFVIGCFTFAYLILFIMFLLRQMRSFNRDPSILQRCVPIMPFLKMIYCGLNFIHWMSCPWLQKDEAMNFIKSFRVTMATLFQTSLCMFFLLNVYGFKISRQSLTQDHIKKLLIIMSVQYFVDSLFTLSGFIPETRIAVSFILNIFSLYMIQFALKNAKLNFDALNLRLAQVQRQQSLDYLAQTIIQKKKLISYATLTMIGYYSYEIYIHGVKNFVFQDENYFQQLNTNIIHEFVDQFCVYCLGLIVTLANQSNNQLGGGMIDISYGNFNHNIREVPQDINYECNIKLDNEFDPESDEKIIKKLDDKTPIILIYPDCENYEFKIGYKEKPKESRGMKRDIITILAKKSCDFGNGTLMKNQERSFKKPSTAMSIIDEKKKSAAKSTSQTRKNRSSSKSGVQQLQFKSSFDSQRQQASSAMGMASQNVIKDQFKSFTKFQSMQQQHHQQFTHQQYQHNIAHNQSQSHSVNLTHHNNNNHSDFSNIDLISSQKPQNNSNQLQLNNSVNQKYPQKVHKSNNNSYNMARHNEYNNNEEDYMKSKKDEVIKTIFKKRKEKMLSMETPKDTLTHHVSSSTFDGFNNSHFHHHNLSQFENPINQISITNIGAIVNTDNQQHSNSISKVLKDKKYRKFAAERTQTPPPPTTMMRMVNTQNSNEKSLQNSSSFISKKQTAYINPKNPDETAYVPSSVTSNKIQSSVQNNKKVNIKLNNFVKTSNKQENNNLLQSISERQKRPQSSNDNISIMSSFSNNTNSIPQTMNNTVNNHHQSSKSQVQYVQNFQLNKNINVKIQQATFLQHQYTFNAHNNTISDLSCDDFNSGILYSSSYDYSVKVWNLTNEGRSLSYEAQFSPFSNDSQHGNRPPSSYSTNNFGSASMIQPIKKFDSKQRQRVNSLVHLGVFGVLAAAGNDKLIKLYTTKFSQNKLEHQHTIKGGHAGVINNLAKVENDMIASSCSDGYIRIFNLSHQNYQEPSLILEQLDSSPELINVLNKNCLLSTGSDGGIRLWDIRQPEAPVQTYHKFHYDKINTIDNLSGYVFASASDDSNINMWDIRMSKMLKQIRFENDHVGCIKFIKQNYLIASHANQLTLLSIRDNFTTRQTFAQNDIEDRFSIQSTLEDTGVQNSTHRTKAIAFSEKDRKLYVAGFDKKIQVWNINLVL